MAKRRGRPGPVVTVTVEQREILERYARGRTVPRALALRARIILDAAAGKPQVEIKRELRITYNTARKWMQRFIKFGLVTLNIEAADLHPTRRHSSSASTSSVGIDRGLKTFAVVADSDGRELDRIDAPKPLRTVLPKLRKESKALSRKKLGSRNRQRARARVSKRHATHGHLVLEDLCTSGLMQTRLARSLADSAWAMFARMLTYEAAWLGGAVTLADRFFPSTRRCSACGSIGQKLTLSERAVAVTRPTATPTLP